ncbi:hypothetical protein ANCDUO_18044, partial [Ancylostoma duodenale]
MSLFVDWAGGEGRTPLKLRPLRPTAHYIMFFLILTIVTTMSQTEASQAEAELYRTLMKNYSAIVRPVRNPNKVLTVSMKVFLQQILNVDEQDQVIEVNAWLKY